MGDKDFLKIAIEEAKKANDENLFGAVIVKNGKIISQEHNTTEEEDDPTSHAEINVIRSSCKTLGIKHLDGTTLYSNAEPCFMCFTACAWAHIKRIVYNKGRKEFPNTDYHTRNYDINDLNKNFDKKLEIIQLDIS